MLTTHSPSLKPNQCPKCTAHCLVLAYAITDKLSIPETKCLICGFRVFALSAEKTIDRQDTIKQKTRRPPQRPRRNADRNERSSYAESVYYWEKAQALKKHREASLEKSERATLRYHQNLFEALADSLTQLRSCWCKVRKKLFQTQHKTGRATEIKDKQWNQLNEDYWLLMRQAMVWYPSDPVVARFKLIRRATGSYDYLRVARKALQKGVQRPYPSAQDALAYFRILELGASLSAEKIRNILVAEKLPVKSRETIRNYLKSFEVEVTIRQRSRK